MLEIALNKYSRCQDDWIIGIDSLRTS